MTLLREGGDPFADLTPMVFDRCDECGGVVGWIDCPTGGWWAHEVHPADQHEGRGHHPTEVEGPG